MAKGPLLIELDAQDIAAAPAVTEAPAVPDAPGADQPQGRAMQGAARLAARPGSALGRWFWRLLLAFVLALVSIAAWDFATGLVTRNAVLGWAVVALGSALALVVLALATRELAALARLGRIDGLRRDAARARASADLQHARGVTARLDRLYRPRADTAWGRERFAALSGDQLDAGALLDLAETAVLTPLDRAAEAEIEAAARRVATVTALVPLAFADMAAALTANLRMIRRIAEIYGGRSGFWGSWRLTRAVMAHLVATGAVAVGDDLLEPVLGGGILSKLSRRFGEGLVNGALTARVGVAAMEVCRPLAFSASPRPRARTLVRRALGGLLGGDAAKEGAEP